ncbi:MAG: rhamnulose-1-phosphate aldolase [Tannerellaceae bacterium]|jgi:rhamnulose-1-phosphate aldolase|nr:rhamnulose-1-phosphate aldolase [Tannerellaceae bacterium]
MIVENELLMDVVGDIAEVAGYLWQKGWAERNGGNISVNVTGCLTDGEIKAEPVRRNVPLEEGVPGLGGEAFYVTGTGKRMRYVALDPFDNGAIIRLSKAGDRFDILTERDIAPTSELSSHLLMHDFLRAEGRPSGVVLHTHPTVLTGLSHCKEYLKEGAMSRLLWSMIPECVLVVPKGVGIVPYEMPGSLALAHATINKLKEHDIVIWEKHGILSVGDNIIDCFDAIDTLDKAARIFLNAQATGHPAEGLTDRQVDELATAFGVRR